MNTELLRDTMISMDEISVRMTEIIYKRYFDKLGNGNKYILSICDDAFKNVNIFCYAIQQVAITQAGTILRQLLEQVAIAHILVVNKELIPTFVEHYKFRTEIADLNKAKQIDAIAEKYGVRKDSTALAYLDYGWIKKDCKEDGMLSFAGFNDIIPWRKKWLDKVTHASFTSMNLIGPNYDYPIVENFVQIASKLFDHLCVAFHNLTTFTFIFDGEDFLNKFRDNYKKLDMKYIGV